MDKIPDEVSKGLTPEAAQRLQSFIDSSEKFQAKVYGEDKKDSESFLSKFWKRIKK